MRQLAILWYGRIQWFSLGRNHDTMMCLWAVLSMIIRIASRTETGILKGHEVTQPICLRDVKVQSQSPMHCVCPFMIPR